MIQKDKAICLRSVDYSDTSQIVTLFAREHGKFSALAKGSKRAKSSFDGPIEIFSYGQILFSPAKSNLATLTEFHQQPVFMPLRRNLFAMNCGMFGAELLEAMTENHDPHPELFEQFTDFILSIQQLNDKAQQLTLLIIFQLGLLGNIGLQPVFSRCANCRCVFSDKWNRVFFSSTANGFICPDCEQAFTDKLNITLKAAQCLNNLKLLAKTDTPTLSKIERMLIYHFSEKMHKQPRMAKHFLETRLI